MKPKTPAQILNQMIDDDFIAKHPGFPEYGIPRSKVKVNGANSLTQAVKKFLILSGHQCERISTSGRVIDDSKVVENVLGQKMKIGSSRYIKGTGTRGSADLSSIINGKSVKWEIKFGKDRQSLAQKEYQKTVERAGGYYFLIHSLDEFMEIYNGLTK